MLLQELYLKYENARKDNLDTYCRLENVDRFRILEAVGKRKRNGRNASDKSGFEQTSRGGWAVEVIGKR